MKVKHKKEGITLIALVITIIVLLILAGVSIATLTGDNGILSKATKAKDETIIAQEKELIQNNMYRLIQGSILNLLLNRHNYESLQGLHQRDRRKKNSRA